MQPKRHLGPVHLALMAALFGAVGCGGGDGLRRVPVQGKVTAKGVAVDQATVVFMPSVGTKGEGGIGSTDRQGNFTLTGSRRGEAGIVPGAYKVRVSRFMDKDGTVLPEDSKQADYPLAIESVPAPYSTPESTLEVTIPEAGGAINVEIPSALVTRK